MRKCTFTSKCQRIGVSKGVVKIMGWIVSLRVDTDSREAKKWFQFIKMKNKMRKGSRENSTSCLDFNLKKKFQIFSMLSQLNLVSTKH